MIIGSKYIGTHEGDILIVMERSTSKPNNYMVKHTLHQEFKWTTEKDLIKIGYTLLEIPVQEATIEEIPHTKSRLHNID